MDGILDRNNIKIFREEKSDVIFRHVLFKLRIFIAEAEHVKFSLLFQ